MTAAMVVAVVSECRSRRRFRHHASLVRGGLVIVHYHIPSKEGANNEKFLVRTGEGAATLGLSRKSVSQPIR